MAKDCFFFVLLWLTTMRWSITTRRGQWKDTTIGIRKGKEIKKPSKQISKEGINLGLKAGYLFFFFFSGIPGQLCYL